MAHIIVVGNEKGGSGKSTTTMHIATALVRLRKRVGVLDLDLRQKTITRYLHNRAHFAKKEELKLPIPRLGGLPNVDAATLKPGEHHFDQRLAAGVAELEKECEFIVIDCPGSHTRLSTTAHSLADTLVTPLNDSFVDFDLLAVIEADGTTIKGPSIYSEMVWSARQLRAKAGLSPIDWIVVRNRLGAQNMVNKQRVGAALDQLGKRIGFRVATGFNERVIFRELFPRGLTLLDLKDIGVNHLNISNVAARQELRDLVKSLRLPNVNVDF